MRNYRRRNASKSSGMSDGTKVAIALAGVAVIGGIGYYFYTQSQAATTAAAGGAGGTSLGGATNAPSILGSGGSSTALGPAAGGNQFEAGAGADAPLVATGA